MAISLANISRNNSAKAPISTIYGTPGVGKTTLAANAPGAIFIRTEDGLGAQAVDAFPLARSYAEVMDAIQALYTEEHSFRWLAVDSLSALEDLVFRQVAVDQGKKNIEEVPYGKGYVMALDYWSRFLDGVTALRNDRGMGILMIAHADIVRFQSPDTDSYDRYQIALDKRAFNLFYERSDIIGFANHKVLIRKEDAGFNRKEAKGVGTGERLLHLNEKPAFIAKNRFGMPDSIPLSWDAFIAALSGTHSNHQAA